MKFITLTQLGGQSIYINSMMINALVPATNLSQTRIYTMSGDSWDVTESVEEIKKKIEDSEKLTFVNKNVKNIW